jgi:molecular chaperone DnaK
VPQVEVTFDIDANGILSVSARDKATGKEQSIKIQASSGLSEQDIQQMVKDAEAHASEDQTRREEVEARNQAEAGAYQVEKQLKENGDKVDAETKAKVEAAIERVREALKGTDVSEIKSSSEALQQAMYAASQQMYQAASGEGGEPGDGGESGGETGSTGKKGSVDADFEVVED